MDMPGMTHFKEKMKNSNEPFRIKRFRISGHDLLYLLHSSTYRIERLGCLPDGASVLSIHEAITCPPAFDLLVEHESFEPVEPYMDPPYHLCQCVYNMHAPSVTQYDGPGTGGTATLPPARADDPPVAPCHMVYIADAEL